MSKYKFSEIENQINKVLKYQFDELQAIEKLALNNIEDRINESEILLKSLGYKLNDISFTLDNQDFIEKKIITIPSWDSIILRAEKKVESSVDFNSLFSNEDLVNNKEVISKLNNEFNTIHMLDKYEVTLSVVAGILGATIDILLVGIPKASTEGLTSKPLSNYIRKLFNDRFSPEIVSKIAESPLSKVPYDAQDNRNTILYVEGLSSYYHRLLSIGHDPLLGLIFGVLDILTGRMTTIDKSGKIISQVMENYSDRRESDIFMAIAKQILHFKSDITTSMGLPAPLMGLFNILQFGSIGDENQTIAEIVQGMYYEGYDFIHFCSQSIPIMIVEVIIRIGYGIMRIKEGKTLKDSLPFSTNRDKNPKLGTMLFFGHSTFVSINAGQICFTKNPLSINYPQWIIFSSYAYKQMVWVISRKPDLRDKFVNEIIDKELSDVLNIVNKTFEKLNEKFVFEFE